MHQWSVTPLLWLSFCLLLLPVMCAASLRYHDYIIVGAGPSGLQLGHFMNKAGRDYVILEKGNGSGTFFEKYPRHDMLISINKRNTGQSNKEFNLRHDWNSLLSDDESLQMRHYSKKMFPPREVMPRYLNDYERKLGIRVLHNIEVENIDRTYNDSLGTHDFRLRDTKGNMYGCRFLVIATGMWKTNSPPFNGSEYTESYEEVSTNPEDFEGQTVLIMGGGNAAYEVADSIMGATNYIHMVSRSRVRLSWATHYVGDLRAVNNNLLDNYQLKSLDGILEAGVEEMNIVKTADGRLRMELIGEDPEPENNVFDNFALRNDYDRIIRCLGFTFDDSFFSEELKPTRVKGRKKKFPSITHDYQHTSVPNMYFAGTNSHSLDHRKSAGGFIHGFRYTTRALHRILEQKNHKVHWPSTTLNLEDLLTFIVKRINEASGTYQMFNMLGDVILIKKDGREFEYFEEFPMNLLAKFSQYTGAEGVEKMIVIVNEYGKEWSAAGNDVFKYDRAIGDPSMAHQSNFLHPVFYYYRQAPTQNDMDSRGKNDVLPRPDRIHHMVEDFLAEWDTPVSHVLPLRRFIEYATQVDMRHFFAEECYLLALTMTSTPPMCDGYLVGGGLMATEQLMMNAAKDGLLFPKLNES